MFSASTRTLDGWRPLELAFCGTYLESCALPPSDRRDIYVPLPDEPSPIRFSFVVWATTAPERRANVHFEWPIPP